MEDTAVLIQKAKNGNQQAFSELVSLCQAKLYTFLTRLSGSREDGQELLQETLLKLCRNLHRYDGRASFQTWAFTIAMNTYKSSRKRKRRPEVSFEALDETFAPLEAQRDTPEELWEKKEDSQAVHHLLGFLKPDQRSALLLKYLRDFSFKDIGKILGITENAAKMKVYRARKEILRRYDQWKGWC